MLDRKLYFEKTDNSEITPFLINFLKKHEGEFTTAIEIGCGTGNDTMYLLSQSIKVFAIDGYVEAKEYLVKKCSTNYQSSLTFSHQKLESLKLPTNSDLIYSRSTLSFCDKAIFASMMQNIFDNMKPGAYFVGSFFGPNDARDKITKISYDDITTLFKSADCTIIQAIQKEYHNSNLAVMNPSVTHSIVIVAQKQ